MNKYMQLKQIIADEGLDSQDYESIANALNQKSLVPNPQEKPTKVSKRVTFKDIFGVLTDADKLKTKDLQTWAVDFIKEALIQDDKEALANQIQLLKGWGILSDASVTAIQKLMTTQIDDPNWSAEVVGQSKAEELGFGRVSAQDVQMALNYKEKDWA